MSHGRSRKVVIFGLINMKSSGNAQQEAVVVVVPGAPRVLAEQVLVRIVVFARRVIVLIRGIGLGGVIVLNVIRFTSAVRRRCSVAFLALST